MSVSHLIKCSLELALNCKESFGDDYDMYLSYLDSLRVLATGESCRIIPLSREEYLDLDVVVK